MDKNDYNEEQIESILRKYSHEKDDLDLGLDDEPTASSKKAADVSASDIDSERRMSRAELMKNQSALNEKQKRIRKARRSNMILNILLTFFILVFVGSGAYLGMYFYKIRKAEGKFNNLRDLIDESGGNAGASAGDNGTPSDGKSGLEYENIDGVDVQKKFVNLYKKNKDFIGWLTIDGTDVDYPVMQTKDDEEFYLKKDFDKAYSASGTLFLGARADIYGPSDNIIIYGHNMKAGTMFHALLSYEKEDYYKEHNMIEFDTIHDNAVYEVIAAFRTEIKEGDSKNFNYYDFVDASSKEEFDDYVSKVKSLTPYTIDKTAEYGDKLITLSTCAYHATEGRYVVVAKKVNE